MSNRTNLFGKLFPNNKQQEKPNRAISLLKEQYSTLFEFAGTGLIIIDQEMNIIDANRKASEISGYSRDEVVGKVTWLHFFPQQEEREKILKLATKRKQEGANAAPFQYECSMVDKEGKEKRLMVNISSVPGSHNIHCSFIDISDLHTAHSLLQQNEIRFKETVEFLPAIYCEFDLEMNFRYMNRVGYQTFGYTEEQLNNRELSFLDFFPKNEIEHVKEILQKRRNEHYNKPEEYTLTTLKGESKNFLVISSIITNNLQPVGMRTCLFDISERKEMERKLQKSETKLKAMFSLSKTGIALTNNKGVLIETNPAFLTLFGLQTIPDNFSLFAPLNISGKKIPDSGLVIEPDTGFRIIVDEKGTELISVQDLYCTWSIIPLSYGNEKQYLFHVTDRTSHKQKELTKLKRAQAERDALQEKLTTKNSSGIIGESNEMQSLLQQLPDIAAMPVTLHITGESGTGKELLADTIHQMSPRKAKPFIAINCGALPDNLLEAELFGYKKGAFTDAKSDRKGKFLSANGGTLFLDEIGEISHSMQVKLLRVLQEREVQPLGSDSVIPVDVRIISATNRDLKKEVAEGRFRQDLFYRIKVISLELPALRQRRTDIPLLVTHFIRGFNQQYNKEINGCSSRALDTLLAYSYPGNIRELQNILEHAFLFCHEKKIKKEHLPMDIQTTNLDFAGTHIYDNISSFEELETSYLSYLLEKFNGSRKRTAEFLGVHKATLFRKLKRMREQESQKEIENL